MYITGYVPFGDKGLLIRVETDIRRGIPGIDISGLAEGAVKEARERVRAAFRNSGLSFPLDRILINLAPAGIKKEGAALDLPMALSVMAAAGLVPGLGALPEQLMVLGELELSGRVRPVRGVLAAVAAGLAERIRFFIVPKENEAEAAILLHPRIDRDLGDPEAPAGYSPDSHGHIHFTAVSSLDEAAHGLVLLTQTGGFPPCFHRPPAPELPLDCGDFADVRGQDRYKRALEIAAAGGHNLLVFGAPGAGKTMLARRFPSIMAELTAEEAVEVTRIHSLAGQPQSPCTLITRPPFRAPHHSASVEGLLGGGRTVRPGEISLAHLGTLFLDEAPEFRIDALQALREPLEEGVLTIVRADGPVKLPANFQLIMAANPCPCGRLGSSRWEPDPEGNAPSTGDCFCSPEEVYRYWRKFGGALLDRIEIRVPVSGSTQELYDNTGEPESSADIRRRVIRAVEIQRRRFAESGSGNGTYGIPGMIRRNARMSPTQIGRFCPCTETANQAYRKAAERLGLSGRSCHGILRTARTIADLEDKELIEADHILEAIQHRRLGEDPFDVLRL
ncbi:MAG: YifB family Mg chelatase-like AAA ATPase [Spirochaetaceae bacterium]|jgi:magnesium chelatase family protein|nr:YifB family Mg chelatase-like AAA ATPase [Spirochaetaceae bacterium]